MKKRLLSIMLAFVLVAVAFSPLAKASSATCKPEVQKEIDALEKKISELKSEKKEMEAMKVKKEARKVELTEEKAKLTEELNQWKKAKQAANAGIVSGTELEGKEIEGNQVINYTKKLADLKRELAELEKSPNATAFYKRIEELKVEIAGVEKALAVVNNYYDDAVKNIKRIESRIAEILSELREINAFIGEDYTKKLNANEKALEAAEKALKAAKATKTKLIARQKELSELISKYKKYRKISNDQSLSLKAEIAKLEKELESLNNSPNKTAFYKRIEELNKEISSKKLELKMNESYYNDYDAKVKEYTKELNHIVLCKSLDDYIDENDDKKPGNDDKKPGNDDKKPGNDDKKPGNDDKKPGNDDKKPGNDDKKPGNDDKKPGNNDKMPADKVTTTTTVEEKAKKGPNTSDLGVIAPLATLAIAGAAFVATKKRK